MASKTVEVVEPKDMELSFNACIDDLRKALDGCSVDEGDHTLEKAKSEAPKKAPKSYDEDAEDEEEAEEDEDEDEDEDMEKSVEDILEEDQEAEASMDVEPFLRQIAKAIDKRINRMQKSVDSKLGVIETLAKAQGRATIAQADLVKSQAETVEKIAKQDVARSSIMRFQKARFEGEDDNVNLDGPTVLEKSIGWLKAGKIDLIESGKIELRVNKGLLGKQNDQLDHKVAKLIKEAV